jgi:putative FmdB family regulatory protein
MPIYEYNCAKCGKTIEVIQRFSDKPLKKHENCGGVLTKLVSASSFHLKGTGWYKTDYAAKGTAEAKDESGNGKKEATDQKTEAPADKPATSKEPSPTASGTTPEKTAKPKSSARKS